MAYYNLATVYSELGQYDMAVQTLNDAILSDWEDVAAHDNRGCVYYKLSQCRRTIEDYDEASPLNPNLPSVMRIDRGPTGS